jgi:hypothetical protein
MRSKNRTPAGHASGWQKAGDKGSGSHRVPPGCSCHYRSRRSAIPTVRSATCRSRRGRRSPPGCRLAELFGNISSAMAATGPLLPREDRSSYRSVGAVQNRPRFPLLLMAGQLEAVSRGRLELPIRAKRPDLSGRTRSLTMKQAWAIGGVQTFRIIRRSEQQLQQCSIDLVASDRPVYVIAAGITRLSSVSQPICAPCPARFNIMR